MKTLRRSIALALSIVMLLSVTVHAAGYTPQYIEETEVLYELGLFRGAGTNADGTPIFALDQKATRIQGLVMLIRLLGKEADALAYTGECPFTDVPSWATRYAAYAYDTGLVNGTTATTYNSDDPLLGKAYVTLALRALGYNDSKGDFSYNDALSFGVEVGLINEGEFVGEIYRDDCAKISFNALKTSMKDAETKLIDKLVSDGVLTNIAVQESGIFSKEVAVPFEIGEGTRAKYTVKFKGEDILALFPDAKNFACYQTNSTLSAYQQMNFTLSDLWAGMTIKYLTGETNDKPSISADTIKAYGYAGGGFMMAFAVLDEEYNMIAYAIIPPGYSVEKADDTLTFTTCSYNGNNYSNMAEYERLQAVAENVKQLESGAIYLEKIITENEDKTETTVTYLRINEEKWPAELQGAAYYYMARDVKISDMLGACCSPQHHQYLKNFSEIFEQGNDFSDRPYIEIYDENKDIIACFKLPKELPVVETIIKK